MFAILVATPGNTSAVLRHWEGHTQSASGAVTRAHQLPRVSILAGLGCLRRWRSVRNSDCEIATLLTIFDLRCGGR